MTIMVKANTAVKNPTGVALVPLVAPRQVKKVRKAATIYAFRIKPSTGTFLFLSMISLAVVVLGFTCGMIMFREYLRGSTIRYRGTCTITSTKDDDYILINAIPYTKMYEMTEVPEPRMYSSAIELTPDGLISQVIEDLAIEDAKETITVHDGRRAFDIIHDFDENTTSIRNEDRCFIMNMIRDFVLEPRNLVQSFHNESLLDLTHAHSFFRAELPAFFVATVPNTGFSRNCFASKPIYRLNLEDSLILRKRSLSLRSTVTHINESQIAPSNISMAKRDFLQFSGNHLQRITISNIDDVLQYEADGASSDRVKAHPKLCATAH